jgi:hypothetical protein
MISFHYIDVVQFFSSFAWYINNLATVLEMESIGSERIELITYFVKLELNYVDNVIECPAVLELYSGQNIIQERMYGFIMDSNHQLVGIYKYFN